MMTRSMSFVGIPHMNWSAVKEVKCTHNACHSHTHAMYTGAATAIAGKDAARACVVAVERAVTEHYNRYSIKDVSQLCICEL